MADFIKTCTRCNLEKPLTEFNKARSQRDGLQSRCKPCHKEMSSKWNKENPDKVIAYRAAYRAANRDKLCAEKAQWRAKNNHICRIHKQTRRARKLEAGGKLSPGLHEKLFSLQRGKCACCGKPISNDYHLDHHMPLALGGLNIDSNIQLLCPSCNLSKGAKHPVDFMQSRGFLL